MSRPTKRIHDLATDTIQDVELNDEEYAAYLQNIAEEEAKAAQEAAKNQAKAALLAQLGINEEQAKLLLS